MVQSVVLPNASRIEGLRRQLSILKDEADKLRIEALKLPAAQAAILWQQHTETCRQVNVISARLVGELSRAVFPCEDHDGTQGTSAVGS